MLSGGSGTRANGDAGGTSGERKGEDHVASYDVLTALIDVTRIWCQVTLDHWYHDGELPLHIVPNALYLTFDWQQIQWRTHWFLRNRCKMSVEGMMELVHRRQRDLRLATREARFAGVVDKAFVCVNAHYGPWQGCTFHTEIREAALSLSVNLDPDDASLLRFWPAICAEMEIPPADQGRDGRAEFLRSLPQLGCIRTKGEKKQ